MAPSAGQIWYAIFFINRPALTVAVNKPFTMALWSASILVYTCGQGHPSSRPQFKGRPAFPVRHDQL